MNAKHNTIKKAVGLSLLLGLAFSGVTASVLFQKNQHKYQKDEYVPEEGAYFVEEITDPTGLVKAHKFVTPTDNQYNTQKTRSLGTSLIGDIESVWTSYTGKGTKIAVIDDGFDYDHPEFTRSDGTSAILSASRYYYASGGSAYYKEYSTNPTCIAEDWEEGSDGYEWATHGTATSTTAAAPMNNGGGVGIAPEADILALKIDFSLVAIKAAIQYAISQGVDVINMSLGAYAENFTDGWGDAQEGSSSTATYLNSVCQSAYNAGIIVVAAAGNESTWHKSYPACNTKVIGVGALGDWDNKGNANKLAEFTNYVGSSQTGEINVDILAPGYVYTAEQTVSSKSDSNSSSKPSTHKHTYADTQGTSFSCPIIAGAACLWKQKYPNGTPDEFLTQLQNSADGKGTYASKMIEVSGWYSNLSDVGPSNIQNGRLNVANLLDVNEPYVSTSQNTFNISVGEKKQINLDTYNGTITYSSANTNVATVNSSGLVEGVGAGNTTITITATKNGNTAAATINVQVAETIAATALSFNPSSVSLTVGDTYDSLSTITTTPSNASKLFMFESLNEDVAIVDFETGEITAVGVGQADIYATAVSGTAEGTLSVTVTQSAAVTDTLTRTTTGVSSGSTNYASWSGKNGTSGATYAGNSAGSNDSIQLRSNNSNSGIVTTASGGKISKVSVDWNSGTASGRTINVYGKNSAYSSASDLYGSSSGTLLGTIVNGSSTELTISGNYEYVGIRSDSGALYLNSITFVWGGSGSSTPTVSVTGVTLDPTELSLNVGQSHPLTATISPESATNKNVIWSSNATGVATVSNGTVTAVAAGNATITVTTADGGFTATCAVTVTSPKTLSSISVSGETTSFKVGDTFAFGGTVTAHYSDSSSADVTSSSSFSGYDMSSAGTQTVTVSYTYNGTTKTTTYQITVSSSGSTPSSSLAITFKTGSGDGTPMNTSTEKASYLSSGSSYVSNIISVASTYCAGSSGLKLGTSSNSGTLALNLDKTYSVSTIVVNAKLYNSSKSATLNVNTSGAKSISSSFTDYIYTINNNISSISLASSKYVWISGLTINTVDTSDKVVNSLSASYTGGDVYVGNSLDTSKVTVTASFTDSVKYPNAVLSDSDYSLTGFNSSTAGNKTVTVTYTGSLATSADPSALTTSFNVTVKADSVTSVSVTNGKTYHPGGTIVKSDITVSLSWESGKAATTTDDFTFASDGYQFTYEDAPSGGLNGNKQFSIVYAGETYNFTVKVSRTNYQTISDSSVTLSSSQFYGSDLSKSNGTASNTSVTIGGVGFTVTTNAYVFTTNNVNYLSFGKTAGSIKNTAAFNYDLTLVTVTQKSGARQDGVLSISKNGSDWVSYSSSEIEKGGYRYFKYEYTTTSSASGAAAYSNLQTISYQLAGQDNPSNVANYIMYEDTNGQCTTKLDVAVSKLNTMTSADKSTFWTSNDYVIATARERLLAWAAHEHKTLTLTEGNFVLSSNNSLSIFKQMTSDNTATIVIIISLVTITAFGAFLFIRKKKEN